jgi:hypothetical protein
MLRHLGKRRLFLGMPIILDAPINDEAGHRLLSTGDVLRGTGQLREGPHGVTNSFIAWEANRMIHDLDWEASSSKVREKFKTL